MTLDRAPMLGRLVRLIAFGTGCGLTQVEAVERAIDRERFALACEGARSLTLALGLNTLTHLWPIILAGRLGTTRRRRLVAVIAATVVTLAACASEGDEDPEPQCPPAKLPHLGGRVPREGAVIAPGELAIEAVAFHIAARSAADSLVLDPQVAEPGPGCPSPGRWADSMTTRLMAAFRAGEASETHRAARAAARSGVVDGVPVRGQPGDARISIETLAVGTPVQEGRSGYRVPVSIVRRVEPHPPDDPFCASVNEAVYLARPHTGRQWIVLLAAIGFPADGGCG